MVAGRLTMRRTRVAMAALAVMAGCSDQPPAPRPVETKVPKELSQAPKPAAAATSTAVLGTPMAQRVATLGLLNKRNNLSQDLKLKPGEARRVGDVIVRLSACERTAPWEMPSETGAFVQVLVRDTASENDDSWLKVFSGWLFKRSPSLNVVEHPIYDVWVKDCAMSFPGEEAPVRSGTSGSPAPRAAPAGQAPIAPAQEPAPPPADEASTEA